jgi:uncharacterized membrane protein
VGQMYRMGVLRFYLIITAVILGLKEAPSVIELISHGISPVWIILCLFDYTAVKKDDQFSGAFFNIAIYYNMWQYVCK